MFIDVRWGGVDRKVPVSSCLKVIAVAVGGPFLLLFVIGLFGALSSDSEQQQAFQGGTDRHGNKVAMLRGGPEGIVFIAKTKFALDRLVASAVRQDVAGIMQMVDAGQVGVVSSGTDVRVYPVRSRSAEVMIIRGECKGQRCWVDSAYVVYQDRPQVAPQEKQVGAP